MRARLADGGDRDHLVLFYVSCDRGVSGAVADRHLLADREAGRAGDRHVTGTLGHSDYRTIRNGLPHCRMVARRDPDACDLPSFHVGAGVDTDGIADFHIGNAPDVDAGIAGARRNHEAGVGESEQVKTTSGELCPVRDFYSRKDSLLARVLRQGPA